MASFASSLYPAKTQEAFFMVDEFNQVNSSILSHRASLSCSNESVIAFLLKEFETKCLKDGSILNESGLNFHAGKPV